MRNFLLTLMVLIVSVTSCGTTRYATQRTVDAMDEVSYVLANYYPQLHSYYMEVIDIDSVYKYVDKNTGKVRLHVSYRRIYDYYYRSYPGSYGGVRIYHYGPRVYPLAPRRMQPPPQPRPQPDRPSPNVRPGNDRPNNPPRGNQNGGNRPPQNNNGGRRR